MLSASGICHPNSESLLFVVQTSTFVAAISVGGNSLTAAEQLVVSYLGADLHLMCIIKAYILTTVSKK